MITVNKIPELRKIRNGQVFKINKSPNVYTHSIFKYPAKFTPEIPNWFIRNCTIEKDLILDCFCGSGTSLLEASLLGRRPLGIDFDPISQLLTRTKTTHLNKSEIFKIKRFYKKLTKKNKRKFYPDLENLNHWFQKDNLISLQLIITVSNKELFLG